MPPIPFQERLRELICRMYRELGFDCANLPHSPVVNMITALGTAADANSPPTPPSATSRIEYILAIDDTAKLIEGPDSTLTPAEYQQLSGILSKLWDDIGP